MTRKIIPITHLYLSHMEWCSKILETLSAKPSQQGKIPTSKGSWFTIHYYINTRPPIFLSTQKIPTSLTIEFLEISYFANLTFKGLLASTTPMPSIWSLCFYSTGIHWHDLEPTTHWRFQHIINYQRVANTISKTINNQTKNTTYGDIEKTNRKNYSKRKTTVRVYPPTCPQGNKIYWVNSKFIQ